MKLRTRIGLLFLGCTLPFALNAYGQGSSIPPENRGNEDQIARGVLDGNLIETNFRNHGELSRYNDSPWGVWPRGIGGRHIDGVAIMIAGQVPGEREKWSQFFPGQQDTLLNPVILTYRDAGKRVGPSGELWGWLPLQGFHNENRIDPFTGQRNPTPALSDDATTWPGFWPDRLDNPDDPGWNGSWNGFFGKGVFNADLESFYVIDDLSDYEYLIDPVTRRPFSEEGVFYPNPADSTMGGLGLQTQVRIFQWANVLAEDVMFILYRITNVGAFNYDCPFATPFNPIYERCLLFTQIMDYGLGQEEGDENASFNPQQDVTFGWDQDGLCNRISGGVYECGYTGFAFLESPASENDGQDNDEDGIVDEKRFGGMGTLVEGQDAIRLEVSSAYDLAAFEAFNGPLENRPAFIAGRWWTGDENLDWVGFSDDNGNGVWDSDAGELLNNDVGLDGLGSFDLGYPGPDTGEGDGFPTPGEPNFDELDVDESDQIGLTGFDLNTRPFYENGDNLRDDTWLWDRIVNIAEPNIILGQKPEAFVADVEPFLLFTSGPVDLAPQTTSFFSTAWIFGDDEQDFFKNRRTVQSIYNADYNFAQPPFLPKLTAIPGDGRVTLTWDTTAVNSFDRFTQEFDFEGFKLYKGTDPLLSDAREITDASGTPTFFRPLAQWDLDDGISGPITVFGGEAIYNLGTDSGLQFSYVDDDVINGVTYYYALVAYDRGFADPDNPDAEPIDPQENTFNVSVTLAGRLAGVSRNAAVVTPRAIPAGYVAGGANEDLSKVTEGIGSGAIDVRVLLEEDLNPSAIYRLNFFSERAGDDTALYTTTAYNLVNVATGETLISRAPLVETTPLSEGLAIDIMNVELVRLIDEQTGYVANQGSANELYSLDPRELDGYSSNWIATVAEDNSPSFGRSPYDYELRWVSPQDSLYTPPRFFGFLREAIPIFAVNATTNEQTELLINDLNDSGTFDAGDELVISEQDGGVGPRRFRYRVGFTAADENNSVPPGPGSVLHIAVTRPFADGDFFQFTPRAPSIDADLARDEMDMIAVVPNPYVGSNVFEPRSQIEGRGERRIQFIHLPPRSTIKVFNLRGELIKTIEHDGVTSDGAVFWDLQTEDGQDVAFGVYLYHVEAPGIGEHIGKFALVK